MKKLICIFLIALAISGIVSAHITFTSNNATDYEIRVFPVGSLNYSAYSFEQPFNISENSIIEIHPKSTFNSSNPFPYIKEKLPLLSYLIWIVGVTLFFGVIMLSVKKWIITE